MIRVVFFFFATDVRRGKPRFSREPCAVSGGFKVIARGRRSDLFAARFQKLPVSCSATQSLHTFTGKSFCLFQKSATTSVSIKILKLYERLIKKKKKKRLTLSGEQYKLNTTNVTSKEDVRAIYDGRVAGFR